MTIPVLGIPVLNVPKLVARLVSSINAPVDKLVFIHNRDEGQPNAELAQTLQRIQTARPRNINSVHIHTFRRNLGVSAAWNAIMLFDQVTLTASRGSKLLLWVTSVLVLMHVFGILLLSPG